MDIVKVLIEYGIEPMITDPVADIDEAKNLYGITFADMNGLNDMDAVIVAVAHQEFLSLSREEIDPLYNIARNKRVMIDVKGIFDKKEYEQAGYLYWRM